MEPVTTTVAIGAVVGYLAKKLADNKSIGDFLNDFTAASVAWIKPIFLTENDKPKEVLQDLIDDPKEPLNADAAATAIAKAVKKNPEEGEKHLQDMYEVLKSKNETGSESTNIANLTGNDNTVIQGIKNSVLGNGNKNIVAGKVDTGGGHAIVGDNNKI